MSLITRRGCERQGGRLHRVDLCGNLRQAFCLRHTKFRVGLASHPKHPVPRGKSRHVVSTANDGAGNVDANDAREFDRRKTLGFTGASLQVERIYTRRYHAHADIIRTR